jgi:hypothetical protein
MNYVGGVPFTIATVASLAAAPGRLVQANWIAIAL